MGRHSRIAKLFEESGHLYFDRPEPEYHYDCGIPEHGENCTRRFPLKDIRDADSLGKFGHPVRYKQIRDIM